MDPLASTRVLRPAHPKIFWVRHAKCITRLLEKCSKINKNASIFKIFRMWRHFTDGCAKFVKLCPARRVALLYNAPAEFMLEVNNSECSDINIML